MAILNADHTFYKEVYGGSVIAEDEWVGYVAKSAAYLTRLDELNKVTPYGDDEEKSWSMAMCAVAEEYHNFDVAANMSSSESCAPVSSASIGSVSVSYDRSFGGAVDLTPTGQEHALHRAATQYLHVYAGLC